MNGRLITTVVTGIAAMAALVAGAVSADVIREPGAFVDQVNLLAEDVGGDQGIERAPFHPAAVAIPTDEGAFGFFEPRRDWIKMVAPTYRAPVADAEMLKVTCGIYPQICAALNKDVSPRISVGAVQNSIDEGALGFLELDGERDWIKMVAPTYRAPVADAQMRQEICGYYPWSCTGMSEL